jgi:hypothetical protein
VAIVKTPSAGLSRLPGKLLHAGATLTGRAILRTVALLIIGIAVLTTIADSVTATLLASLALCAVVFVLGRRGSGSSGLVRRTSATVDLLGTNDTSVMLSSDGLVQARYGGTAITLMPNEAAALGAQLLLTAGTAGSMASPAVPSSDKADAEPEEEVPIDDASSPERSRLAASGCWIPLGRPTVVSDGPARIS